MDNYGSLETFYGKKSSESDKYIHKKEDIKIITPDTNLYELEDIVTKGQEKKWLSKKEAENSWKY